MEKHNKDGEDEDDDTQKILVEAVLSGSWISLWEGLFWHHVLGLEEVKQGIWEISTARSPQSYPQVSQSLLTWPEFPDFTLGRESTCATVV